MAAWLNHSTRNMVEPFDTEYMANEIIDLLHTEEKRIAYGEKAREHATQCYSMQVVAGQYLSLYEHIINSNGHA